MKFIGGFPMNFMSSQIQRNNGNVEAAIGDFKMTPHPVMAPVLKERDG